ncbi:MAG: propionyl-CoA synthetase, partial [Gammaproteobacteria bacterium]
MSAKFDQVFARSIADPNAFWAEVAEDVHWYRRWDRVLDDSASPIYRWFPGALVNTCYNAVDVHVEQGRGAQAALIYDSPVTDTVEHYTYAQLLGQVARVAGALAANGVGKGDRVIIYMPMIPQAVFAMLACARLGAVHCVVFGGFAANELAVRIDDCKPTMVVCASCGIEPGRVVSYKPLLDKAIELAAHKPARCLVFQRPQERAELIDGRDLDWTASVTAAAPHACVPVEATDPLYILYTSGTTGQPKGVVRDNGGHVVALKWTMKNIYGVEPGEVYWAASDIGWV